MEIMDMVRCENCNETSPKSIIANPHHQALPSGGERLYLKCPHCKKEYEYALLTPDAKKASDRLDELPTGAASNKLKTDINKRRAKLRTRLEKGMIRPDSKTGEYSDEHWLAVGGKP